MVVNKFNYPTLYRAFQEISYDNAGPMTESYEVPDATRHILPTVERALAQLSFADLMTLCVGEHTDMEAVARYSRERELAHEFLAEFFSDFQDWR